MLRRRRKSSFTTLCYVFVERFPIRCVPFPPIHWTSCETLRRFGSSKGSRRIRERTLTRLAINLFVLLNVILFYCWIKERGNIVFGSFPCSALCSQPKICFVLYGKRPRYDGDSTHRCVTRTRKYDVVKNDVTNYFVSSIRTACVRQHRLKLLKIRRMLNSVTFSYSAYY